MKVRMWFATGMRFSFFYGDSICADLLPLRKTAAAIHLWGFSRVRSHWILSHVESAFGANDGKLHGWMI